jgi:glycosyltransferase involved in cell wall biosynthesis
MQRTIQIVPDGPGATVQILQRSLASVFPQTEVIAVEHLPEKTLQGALVFSRLCHPRYRWIPAELKRLGKPYAYFLDDNFYAFTPEQDPYHAPFFTHPSTLECLDEFIREAKEVIVFSDVLRRELQARHPSANVKVLPAPVDIALFDRHASPVSTQVKSEIRIGYPSTRRAHLESLIAGIVDAVAQRYGTHVVFEFVGWWPAAVTGKANVRTFPAIADYESYVAFAMAREWDIAIAPLGESKFENAKTNLKFREYGAMGIPAVYSETPLFAACVEHGKNGLLAASNPASWCEAISSLVESSTLRASIREAARADVREKHHQATVASQFGHLLFGEVQA